MRAQLPPDGRGRCEPHRTREERFREIRDAIMAQSGQMRPSNLGGRAGFLMQCGPFTIAFYPLGALGPYSGFNINIWPAAKIDCGHMVTKNKVANVHWDQSDNIDIVTFRSGPWEAEILSLLRGEEDVLPFG